MSEEVKKPTKKDAIATLWKRGILFYKLNDSQKDLYDLVANSDQRIITFLCSRRFGKSYTLCVLAVEQCIKQKNSIVKYLCPDAKQAKNFVIPIIREIVDDCPKALRPEYLKQEGKYVFPNGSEIQIAGNDGGRAESLRGGLAHLCIVDEAGFCDELKYNVRSVLLPTVATTGGKIILSSTPPRTPGHEFLYFISQSKTRNSFIKKTVFENPRFSPAEVQEFIDQYGSIEDPEFRREYLCELSVNLDDAIVPEFTAAIREEIVTEWERPPFFDFYESMDIGFEDFTVVLFAYYDFKNDKIVIEDELILNKMTTQILADGIKAKERKLLYSEQTGEQKDPFLRISDTNPILLHDLQIMHSLTFLKTQKDNKEAAVNNMRLMINAKRIIINPRCVTLIKHLEEGVWKKSSNKNRTYDRSADNGHYDAIDALVYLVRNVMFGRNPYPKNYNDPGFNNRFKYNDKKTANPVYQQMAGIFKMKKSL